MIEQIQPGDIDRVILHWDGGGAYPSSVSIKAYNALIDQDSRIHKGRFSADDNIDTSDGIYAAHTLHANTKAFGLALCGMHGAREHPLVLGSAPINEEQFIASAKLAAKVLRAAALPVAEHTALSHAEVESVLGIRQRGKWDITVLPWRSDIRGAKAIGDYWRHLIRQEMGDEPVVYVTDPHTTLRMGNRTPSQRVRIMQHRLAELGYHNGRADGLFGRRTRAAVLAFQADHDLSADGVAGPITLAALYANEVEIRPERAVTERDLREAGSRTIQNADNLKSAGIATMAIPSAATVLENLEIFSEAGTWLEKGQELLFNFWPILLFIGLGLFIWYFAQSQITARVDDARSGANSAR